MIKSMTGFGTHKLSSENYEIKADIKSVNNRYLDIQIKGPKSIVFMEDELKRVISSKVSRGKIDCFVDIRFLNRSDNEFQIDYSLLKNYSDIINDMSSIIHISKDFNIIDLLKFDNNLLKIEKKELSEDSIFISLCKECIEKATLNFLEMKLQEGYNIGCDLKDKLLLIESIVSDIELKSKNLVNASVKILRERIAGILSEDNIPLDEDRLVNEIVFYSDRLSIDEEIVRLKSHINLFFTMLNDENSNGKKMDFLIQEMNRETNTIGSKSSSVEITNDVINLKSIIEKLREQVQNIE